MTNVSFSRFTEIVFTDLVRPMKTDSLLESGHFITMFVEHSEYSMVKFLKFKTEAPEVVIGLFGALGNLCRANVENSCTVNRHKVRYLRTDNGTKFITTRLQSWLERKNKVYNVPNFFFSRVKCLRWELELFFAEYCMNHDNTRRR